MAEFVLHPVRLRGGKFVVVRDSQPLVLSWAQLRDRVVPSHSRPGMMLLRSLRPGSIVGTRRRGDGTTSFVLEAAGKSSSVAHVLRKDPAFESDLMEAFLVEKAEWDAKMVESTVAT